MRALQLLPTPLLLPLTAFLLSLFTLAAPATAGDSAQLNIIGYSEDGKIFAFEEYGIFDGSGFAYSNYYFLDTVTDKFLPGSPIKVKVDDEASVAKIRQMARAKAEPLIKQYGVESHPGYLAAYNPISEVDSDPHRVRFHGFPVSPPLPQIYVVELKEKPFPTSKDCLNMTGSFTGFSLTYAEEGVDATARVIYEDKQVPASRNCPNGYRLGAIVVGDARGPSVAMILVSSFGFEGNDERWIAIPINIYEQ